MRCKNIATAGAWLLMMVMDAPIAWADTVRLDTSMVPILREVEERVAREGILAASRNWKNKPKQREIMRLFAHFSGDKKAAKRLGGVLNAPVNKTGGKKRSMLSPPLDDQGKSRATLHFPETLNSKHEYSIFFTHEMDREMQTVVVWREKNRGSRFRAKVFEHNAPYSKIGAFFGACEKFGSYVIGVFDVDDHLVEVYPQRGVITPSRSGTINPADRWACADSYILHAPS